MLTIRLFRIGKKNKPVYRLIISEKKRDTRAPALERLAHTILIARSCKPMAKELNIG